MIPFEIHTVFIICCGFIFLYAIGMVFFARKVSHSFNGIDLFAIVNFLLAIGILLVSLRGHLNIFWSIVVANSLNMLASTLIYQAHLRFINYTKPPVFLPAVLLIAAISLMTFFTYAMPNNGNYRIILINSFHCLQFVLIAWTISRWQRQQQENRYTPLLVIATIIASILAYRVVSVALSPPVAHYQLQGNFAHSLQVIVLMFYIAAMDFSIVLITTGQLVEKIAHLAYRDYLTALYNRRGLDHVWESDAVSTKSLSVIMCDIDHFKIINDCYGHDVGDLVLQKFASLIESITRKTDICVRWGGEEFLVILPLANQQEAVIVAEKIRLATEKQRFPEFPDLCFTSSFGICVKSEDHQTLSALISRADNALYQAKNEGRNKVNVFLFQTQ